MPFGSPEPNRVKPPQAAQADRIESAARSPWNLRRLWTMLLFVALPVFVLDQASKLYIVRHLALYQEIALIPHWAAITHTENPGAAFSLFATVAPAVRNLLLGGLAAGAIVVLGVLLARGERPALISVAFALILGGAGGNLADRALRGRVVDFIYVHYYAWSYPVFNLADCAITVGVALILLHSAFSHDADSG